MNTRSNTVSVDEALEKAPTLSELIKRAQLSGQYLKTTFEILPRALHSTLQAGPIEGTQWCLIASNNAVASKMKQLLPRILSHLQSNGMAITHIRIKVSSGF